MPELPTGTVTLLFSDIEGSTRLLKALGDEYGNVLAEHQRLLRAAFEGAGGHEIDTQGDAFFVAFARAKDAVAAALAAQRSLASNRWPDGQEVRVRIGIHTAEPTVGGERYVGLGVHRAARICSAGHGGQILLSGATRELVEEQLPPGIQLLDLGEHHLKDLERPERIFQLCQNNDRDAFPPLKTVAAQPAEATPFAGREGELAAAATEAVVGPRRLRNRRGLIIAGALALALVAAAVAAVLVLSGGGPATVEVVPNSVVLVDPAHDRLVDLLRIPAESPGPIDVAGGKVWVLNRSSFSITVIDAKTRMPVNTFGVSPNEGYPNGLAADPGGVWLTGSASSRVTWYGRNLTEAVEVAEGGYTLGTGSELARIGQDLWVTGVIQPLVAALNISDFSPSDFSPKVLFRLRLERAPTALAVDQGYGYVGDAQGNLVRIDAVTQEQRSVTLAGRIEDIVVAGGSIWLVTDEQKLLRLAPGSLTTSATVDLPDPPSALAFGAGGVWVVSADAGTVTHVDPESMKVLKTITIGHRPQGVAVAEGLVWVTVRR
jgi:class 3 adenylate cyclase/streptogramin lyase